MPDAAARGYACHQVERMFSVLLSPSKGVDSSGFEFASLDDSTSFNISGLVVELVDEVIWVPELSSAFSSSMLRPTDDVLFDLDDVVLEAGAEATRDVIMLREFILILEAGHRPFGEQAMLDSMRPRVSRQDLDESLNKGQETRQLVARGVRQSSQQKSVEKDTAAKDSPSIKHSSWQHAQSKRVKCCVRRILDRITSIRSLELSTKIPMALSAGISPSFLTHQ